MRPFIPIILVNPMNGMELRTYALVDTGADASSLPEFVVQATGHDLKGINIKSSISSGIGGFEFTTWKHTFIIGLLDASGNEIVRMTPEIEVDCLEHNFAPPILGVKDFLKDFKIIFDYPNRLIVLEWDF